MKKISVHIQDKYTLVLDEDAQKGDIIDLNHITSFDSSGIEHAIATGVDQLYEEKKKELKKQFEIEKQQLRGQLAQEFAGKMNQAQNELRDLKQQNELALHDLSLKHQLELQQQQQGFQLKQQEFEQYKRSSSEKEEQLKLKMAAEWQERLSSMERELAALKQEKIYQKSLFDSEKEQLLLKKNQELEKIQNQAKQESIAFQGQLEKQRLEYENQIQTLQRQKASLNVKQTGEDLESWCDNEVKAYMQNGFSNCVWIKDNLVVKEDGETKGSKADYLFKIYVDEQHQPQDLLASVCLDMKDENPDSVNKKKNSDYYHALDKNRTKKNCKYAVLVSNLETDKTNDLPIFKVSDYPDMYVVRPAYLMTFLNMLVSLSSRFQELIKHQAKEDLLVKDKMTLLTEFEELKNTYLDKPLEALKKDVDEILKQNELITKAARKIEDSCFHVVNQYINGIADKLSRFERKLH